MSTGAVSPQHPAVPLRHRLNIDKLSTAQLASSSAAAHGHPISPPWHRAYLSFFELSLRDLQPGVTLPWWDWTADRHIPAAYNERDVGGQPNPLFSAKVDPLAVEQGAAAADRKG